MRNFAQHYWPAIETADTLASLQFLMSASAAAWQSNANALLEIEQPTSLFVPIDLHRITVAANALTLQTESVEALQEFKTTNFMPSAEYGRTTGGVMSFATKSGTDNYHGTLFNIFPWAQFSI
ncbi:MAG TPA: hypothetical protein VFB43_16460 [Terracidiphilus sp.]|nr:hypothetical protein [Terracidiphilus sp.]